MIPLDLRAAERRKFESALTGTHELRVKVRLLSLDGDDLADLSDRLLDGQVNIDTAAETDRSCSLTLDDPHRALHLDSDAPGDGALYVDRLVRVLYEVYVPALSDWVRVPVFTGPVASLARDGSQVELTALGKEYLAKGQCWRPLTIRKGHDTVTAIKTILAERAGETRFAFPDLGRKLPHTVSLGRMTQPWAVAQRLARSLDRQLYYDGEGVCRLRSQPQGALYSFRSGNGAVLTDPAVAFDLSSVKNAVWVKGGKPKGHKHAVTNTAVAPRSHPLSPWRLGRQGTPRFLVEEVTNDHVRTKLRAGQLARSTLNDLLFEGVTVTFDALPIPHLDPLDVVRVRTDELSVTFRLRQASIPLVHSGVMSVGAVKRVTPARKRIR